MLDVGPAIHFEQRGLKLLRVENAARDGSTEVPNFSAPEGSTSILEWILRLSPVV